MIKNYLNHIVGLICICFDFFVLESAIKYILVNKIPAEGFYLIPGILQLQVSYNSNIAFGLPVPNSLSIVIVVVVLIFLGYLWWLNLSKRILMNLWAVSLIIIGALSNLIDRLLFLHVIDYINLYFWPIFNLADTMIVVGVMLYFLNEAIIIPRKNQNKLNI